VNAINADIVYNNILTFKLVKSLYSLLENRQLYVSMERRIHFTVEGTVCAPNQDYFFDTIDAFNVNNSGNGRNIVCEQIDLKEVPQAFNYTRTPQMELWKLWLDVE
jgi:hypothetical protein